MGDLDGLDDFSKSVADHLFESYPAWRTYAYADRESDSNEVYLVVRVPQPTGADLEQDIVIWTEGGAVVVAVDYYHDFFKWPSGAIEGDFVATIAAIVNEELVIASWWDGPAWLGAKAILRGERIRRLSYFRAATRVRVRSWRGSFDQDIEL